MRVAQARIIDNAPAPVSMQASRPVRDRISNGARLRYAPEEVRLGDDCIAIEMT